MSTRESRNRSPHIWKLLFYKGAKFSVERQFFLQKVLEQLDTHMHKSKLRFILTPHGNINSKWIID